MSYNAYEVEKQMKQWEKEDRTEVEGIEEMGDILHVHLCT